MSRFRRIILCALTISGLVVAAAVVPAQAAEQANPPVGLDRIDAKDLPLNQKFTYTLSGKGVHVYVLDTGIRAAHGEFFGRVATGFDAIDGDATPDDCHGRGTHVAGTIAGEVSGVAKEATIHAVRVAGCDGITEPANLVKGLAWVAQQVERPAVVSVTGTAVTDEAITGAVHALLKAQIPVVLGAGDGGGDACAVVGEAAADALVIAAAGTDDRRVPTSNAGRCVDLFAPGQAIVSANHNADEGTVAQTGTAMAAAHAAGVVATIFEHNPNMTPPQISALLTKSAALDHIGDPNGAVNRLLQNTFTGGIGDGGFPELTRDALHDEALSGEALSGGAPRTAASRAGARGEAVSR